MKPIRFGTDGWRGVIADDVTYDRVGVVCAAIGDHLEAEGRARQGVAIGYDNRFASEEFAQVAAAVLTRRGISVRLSNTSIPTPLVSFATRHFSLAGGIAITASHNPPPYNGVKFKAWYGGSAPAETTQELEARANELLATLDMDALRAAGPRHELLRHEDFIPAYLRHVQGLVDVPIIGSRSPRLLVDPLYGSSLGVLDRALKACGCRVRRIHDERHPLFGGLLPEPMPEQLHALRAAVLDSPVDGGLASDGDGDRLAAMTETGQYVSPHHVFALLLMHLVEDRGQRGGVVKTVSTTTMIDQLAERYGLPVFETPIGFKYIGELMRTQDILIGGEESGGIGVRGHLPERDATVAALLLAEMLAARNTTLDGLLRQLEAAVGVHCYHRNDLALAQPLTPEQQQALRRAIPPQMLGRPVVEVQERDGFKVRLDDRSWLLLRPSGTEPVMRVYAESDTPAHVEALLEVGCALVTSLGIEKAA